MRPLRLDKNNFSDRSHTDVLPKEVAIENLPDGEWAKRGVYRIVHDFEYGMEYGAKRMAHPRDSGILFSKLGGAEEQVYIDTETTGLFCGAGTYAFLIGIGRAYDNFFRVTQLFLISPAWERNFLDTLESEFPENYGLVSYNGKQFDIPMLRTRYMLSRLTPSWNCVPHLDLLLLARHFYRGILDSCSLSSIERNIIGLHRSGDDVPGSEIPRIYTHFLQTGDAYPLHGIFYHNMLDIVSLTVLQNHFANLMKNAYANGVTAAHEQLRAGDLWKKMGESGFADISWNNAAECGETDGAMRIACEAARHGNYSHAAALYKTVIERSRKPNNALIALAKIEEHKLKDYLSALEHSKAALQWHISHKLFHSMEWENEKRELEHRIKRIIKKLERDNGSSDS